jgi:hypothetical protein
VDLHFRRLSGPTAQPPDNPFTITLTVPQAGVCDVRNATKKFTTRRIVQRSVNDIKAGPAEDQYNSSKVWQEFDLGNVSLAADNQPFVCTTTGKNAASSGYAQAYDYVKLTPQEREQTGRDSKAAQVRLAQTESRTAQNKFGDLMAGAVGLEPTPSSLTVRCPTNWTTPQPCTNCKR